MLMSYAFITTGDKLFVVPDGFDRGATRSLEANDAKITVPNPAQGHLTNDMDRPVIESLTRAAESSQAFTCWRMFVKHSTASCLALSEQRGVGDHKLLSYCYNISGVGGSTATGRE